MAEIPGLRPIDTPQGVEDGGQFFGTPSPPQSRRKSLTSGSGGGPGCSSSEGRQWASTDEVLPQHYGNGGGGADGGSAVFRRIRTTLASPFQSPLLGGRGGKGSKFRDENILQGASSSSKRRRNNAHRRSEGGACLLLAASLAGALTFGLCIYSFYTGGGAFAPFLASSSTISGGSNSGSGAEFVFRPAPAVNSPSYDAVERFRSSYKTVDRTKEGGGTKTTMIGIDDPLNPGSIFVVLDVPRPSPDDDENNFINRDGALFGQARELALGFERSLSDRLPSLLGGEGVDVPKERKLVDVTSFYSLLEENLPHIAGNKYATEDGLTTLIEIGFAVPSRRGDDDQQQKEEEEVDYEYVQSVIKAVKKHVQEFSRFDPKVDVGFTGLPLLRADLLAAGGQEENQLPVTSTTSTTSLKQLLPPTAPSLVTYRRMADRFGWGIISPYKIVFDRSGSGHLMDTDPGFEKVHLVMRAFADVDLNVETVEEEIEEELETADGGIVAVNLDSIPQRIEDGHMDEHLAEVMDEMYGPPNEGIRHGHLVPSGKPPTRTVYNGVAFLRNNMVPYPLYLGARICREKQGRHCTIELLHYLTTMTDAMTSPDRASTYVSATLGVDPYSEDGVKWLVAAREKIRELEGRGVLDGFKVTIVGGASLEYDALQMAGAGREAHNAGDEPSSSSVPFVLAASSVLILLVIGFIVRPSMLMRGKSKAYDHKRV